MDDSIKVYVVNYPGRTNLVMRYCDPFTGKQIARSTGTDKQRESERVAAKWEAELREGRYQKRCRMTWEEFHLQFMENGTASIKPTTVVNYQATFRALENLLGNIYLADLTSARVTAFANELRKPYIVTTGKGKKQRTRTLTRSEASVARHLRHLKAAARWAHRQGLLQKLPTFDMPNKASGASRMKGRPITGEEFDRMLAATPKVVGEAAAESWQLLLRGLWASGLRLGEAMNLRWDRQPGGVSVILNGQKSVLAFDAGSQKSGKVQLVPLAPEAVQLLEPIQRKAGKVFTPLAENGRPIGQGMHLASKIVCQIGRKAGVIVDVERGKFASAHDLRRAFGQRWSRRVMPPVLKELMRHASIETTMSFYVGQNAESTSAELWQALGNILGNTPKPEPCESIKNP